MIPLYREPHFTFSFREDRIVSRFHLDGVAAGVSVSIAMIDRGTQAGTRFMTATVGNDGWVDLDRPLIIRAGGGFIVTPETETP